MTSENLSQTSTTATSIPSTRRDLTGWLLRITRPVLAPLALSILMRIIALVAGAALFGYATFAAASITETPVTVSRAIIVLVVIALVKAVTRYLEQFFGHFVAFKALAVLRTYFYDRLEPQAPAATDGRPTGDLLSRATRDIDRIEVFFAHTLGPAITAVIVPIGLSVWLGFAMTWQVGLLAAIIWLLMAAIVPVLGARRALPASQQLREQRGEIAQHVTDSIQGAREVRVFNYEDRRRAELSKLGDRMHHSIATAGRIVALRRGLNAAAMIGALSAATLIGAHLVSTGTLTVPQLALALGAILGGMPAVTAVEEFTADLDQAFASAARVAAVTEAQPVTEQSAKPVMVNGDRPARIELSQVRFSYPVFDDPKPAATPVRAEAVEVLHGIDLTLEPGTVTALVGASGSGKSTIAHLVARFYDPTSGSITLNDVDLRNIDDESLRRRVTIVGQRPYLFNATIAENLRSARPQASDEEIEAACTQAALWDTIASLPDGLNTMVGEHGLHISGGQRQRIAIARALLQGTDVIILDEVTSQLDRETEAELADALQKLQSGRTTLMVAHRISAITHADKIVVVDRGQIVAQGTHDELLATSEYYRTLVEAEHAAI